jgi:trehalose 6-phosphate synthase
VLSNRAGAACELTEALLVNPYDTRGIARAIQRALTMPLAERRARHSTSLATLRENDIHRWHTRFVDDLQAARGRCPTRRSAEPTELSAFRRH